MSPSSPFTRVHIPCKLKTGTAGLPQAVHPRMYAPNVQPSESSAKRDRSTNVTTTGTREDRQKMHSAATRQRGTDPRSSRGTSATCPRHRKTTSDSSSGSAPPPVLAAPPPPASAVSIPFLLPQLLLLLLWGFCCSSQVSSSSLPSDACVIVREGERRPKAI